MAGFTHAGRNAMLDGLAVLALYASLHSAEPGPAGTSELAGGGPAYARRPIPWGRADLSAVTTTEPMVFDVPPGTVAFIGYWSSPTGGTFYGSRPVAVREEYAGQGVFVIPSGSLTETFDV